MHDYFNGVDSSCNDVILSAMVKYIILNHLNTISFELLMHL